MKHLYSALAVAAISLAATDVCAQNSKMDRVTEKAPTDRSRSALVEAGLMHRVERPMTTSAVRGGGVTNPDCASAQSISVIDPADCATLATIGNNNDAPVDGDQPGCDDPSEAGFQDVWYTFNSGSNLSVSVALTPADPETQDWGLVVLDACGGTEVFCGFGVTAPVVIDVTENTDYFVEMYSNLDYGTGGEFTLCVAAFTPPDPPANDECDAAIALTTSTECVNTSATLAGATQSLEPATCSNFTADQANDVWFSFVAGAGSNVVTVTGAEDVVLEVFEGDCAGLNSLGCVDAGANGEQISFPSLTEGTTYYARVYAWSGEVTAPDFDICVRNIPPIVDVYCLAGADGTGLGLEERIINVNFAGINNDSPDESPIAPAYSSFIDVTGTAAQGAVLPIAVDVSRNAASTGYSENQVLAWIDFDQNQEFDAVTELVFTSEIGALDIYEGEVTIPGTATLGATRMRVRLHDTHDGSSYENNFNDTPCGIASYGEVEDYTIEITGPTGFNERDARAFSVFPNPTNGDITVNGANLGGSVLFELTDMTGRVVYAEGRNVTAGQAIVLPIAGKVAAGSYSLSLMTEGNRSVQTVVIR